MQTELAPGGPRGFPLLGSLPAYRKDPAQFVLGLQRDYGGVTRLRLGPYPVYLVTDPDGVRQILQANDANYCRGRFYEKFKIFFGKGLLTTDGDEWREHRRVAQPAFLKRVVMQSTTSVVGVAGQILDEWGPIAAEGRPVDLVPEMMRLTLAAISRSLFGMDVSDAARERIAAAVDFGVETMFNQGNLSEMLPRWMPTRRNRLITEHRRVLTAMVDRIRAEHQPEKANVDLVQLLEGATDEAGASWTDGDVHDELLTIFLAGHETTALALCWSLYAVAQHHAVREELEAEVDAVLGGGAPTIESIGRLTYTRMVVQEALRLYPPIWLYTRDAIHDDVVAGYKIPAGSSVLVSPLATHRHPDLWEDPEMFEPRRFDPQAGKRPTFAYFPFGGGPRQCIGMYMALQELTLVVAMVTQRFRMHVVPGHPVRFGSRVLSLRPSDGMVVRLRDRHVGATPLRNSA